MQHPPKAAQQQQTLRTPYEQSKANYRVAIIGAERRTHKLALTLRTPYEQSKANYAWQSSLALSAFRGADRGCASRGALGRRGKPL